MKKVIVLFFAFMTFSHWVNGQNNGQRKKTLSHTNTTQRTSGQNKPAVQQPASISTKDYPLDTTGLNDFKSGTKPAATNVTGKTTNPQTSGQNQQTIQQPTANNPKWRDDSLLWIKNNSKPAATNVSGKSTNNQTSNQNRRATQPKSTTVSQTKLDDLKNPFDSTRKVKPGVNSGQAPASRKARTTRQ